MIDKLTDEVKKEKGLVVMNGEVTGHMHLVLTQTASIFEQIVNNTKLRFLFCPEPSIITHEEHGRMEIPKGIYEIGRVREYDPFEDVIRAVRD